jgi:hypothetical protein
LNKKNFNSFFIFLFKGIYNFDEEKNAEIEDKNTRIDLNQQQSLKFFMGGFGDARHFYTSLIDLHEKAQTLPAQKQNNLSVFFLLNDIKPHALARVLIILSLLRKLAEFKHEQIGAEAEPTKIAAALMYVFACNVMPSYLESFVAETIKTLVETGLTDSYWKFLNIDDNSWNQTKKVLQQWTLASPIPTQRMMRIWSRSMTEDTSFYDQPNASSSFKDQLAKKSEQYREDFLNALNKLPDDADMFVSNKHGLSGKEMKQKMIKNMETKVFTFDEIKNISESTIDSKPIQKTRKNNKLAKNLTYLMPPELIQDKQEQLLWSEYISALEAQQEDLDESEIKKKLENYVKKHWKSNVSILDYDWHAVIGENDLKLGENYSTILDQLFRYLPHHEPANSGCLFDWFALYFYLLAKSVKFLTDLSCLTVESRIDDVNNVVAELAAQAKRKAIENEQDLDELKFDRMYLSNIPDYTSMIYVFVECMPMLKFGKSFIRCNVLMNTGIWNFYEDYVYSGSLIQSLEQASRVLNAKKTFGELWGEENPLWTLNESNFKPSMSSRAEVLDWLSRVLLAFAFPGKRDAKKVLREVYAPNLVVFFKAIQYLISIGNPKHWFQAYLTSILENKLVTSERAPVKSPNTHREANRELKHVDLSSVLIELQTFSSLYSPVLGLGELNGSKPIDSIREFKLEFDSYSEGKYFAVYKCNFAYSPVLGLLFEENADENESDDDEDSFLANLLQFDGQVKSRLREELMNRNTNRKCLFSVIDFCSRTKTAKFWMSKQDHLAMADKWSVSLIRTDSWERLASRVELSKAVELNQFC